MKFVFLDIYFSGLKALDRGIFYNLPLDLDVGVAYEIDVLDAIFTQMGELHGTKIQDDLPF